LQKALADIPQGFFNEDRKMRRGSGDETIPGGRNRFTFAAQKS
jgi:hypothetical protein